MRIFLSILLLLGVSANAFALKIEKQQLPFINYVSIPVTTGEETITLSGQLRIPRDSDGTPFPAVIIVHSSAGVDSTGLFYAKALNKVGIATLELDLWGARGLSGGSADRPGLPTETLPDAYAALQYMAQRADIDADRIGIMGFSWGAVVTLLTANQTYDTSSGTDFQFAGHVAHSPVCWAYNVVPTITLENLTGSPVLIQAGELDGYDLPDTCENLKNSLSEADQEHVEVITYRNAEHAWDRLEPTWIVEDPFANLGQGGLVALSPNKRVAKKSRKKVVNFFSDLFDLEDDD